MSERTDPSGAPGASVEQPTRRCDVCRERVQLSEWDYGVCDRCRSLAGTGLGQDLNEPSEWPEAGR